MTTLVHAILAALVAVWHVADSALLAARALASDARASLAFIVRRAWAKVSA